MDLTFVKLIYLAFNIKGHQPGPTVEWITAHYNIMDNLRKACRGEYSIIQSLASVLENGTMTKRLLDHVINKCM